LFNLIANVGAIASSINLPALVTDLSTVGRVILSPSCTTIYTV